MREIIEKYCKYIYLCTSSYLRRNARVHYPYSDRAQYDTCHWSFDRVSQKHVGSQASFRFVVAY